MAKRDTATELDIHVARLEELPSWEHIPDIDLYMEQVLSLVTRYLGQNAAESGKGITSSMVNNYVKTGLVPAPVKKRYGRDQLALLLIVCSLKSVLPLASIRTMFERELANKPVEVFYETFRTAAQDASRAAQDACAQSDTSALQAALRARAERDAAIGLLQDS